MVKLLMTQRPWYINLISFHSNEFFFLKIKTLSQNLFVQCTDVRFYYVARLFFMKDDIHTTVCGSIGD